MALLIDRRFNFNYQASHFPVLIGSELLAPARIKCFTQVLNTTTQSNHLIWSAAC